MLRQQRGDGARAALDASSLSPEPPAVDSAEARLDAFIDRYSAEVAALAKGAVARLAELMPGATRLVYDNYNALAVGFSPDGRPSNIVVSVTLYPRWVSLFFTRGAELSDPAKLLKGGGKQMRHLVLRSAADLDHPEVLSLIERAAAASKVPLDPAARGEVIIQSVSAKQRPRRPEPVSGPPDVDPLYTGGKG